MVALAFPQVLDAQFGHVEAEEMAAFRAVYLRPPRRIDEEILAVFIHQVLYGPLSPRHIGKVLAFGPGIPFTL